MKRPSKTRVVILVTLVAFMTLAAVVYSHCQIPCGIYDDAARLDLLAEHIKTIEKSMKQIEELSAADKPNYNQVVRWVNNKDNHADEFSNIVTYYFMAQRLKPAEKQDKGSYDKYINKLTLLHKMVYYSMKCKQTTDQSNVEKLKSLLADFRQAYSTGHVHEK